MIDLFKGFGRQALFLFDPEKAHGLSIGALKSGLVPACRSKGDPRLRQTVAGLEFPNPLGMAAGYDKNAEVPEALLRLGFGFTEVGTVTPSPRPAIRGRVSSGLSRMRPSSTASVSTMKAMTPPIAGCLPSAAVASSASISELTRTAATALPTTSPGSPVSTSLPAISLSTFPRRTRPACATCRPARAWPRCSPRFWQPGLPKSARAASGCRSS